MRQANAARMPWVAILQRPRACDGIKWSTVALKDLYEHGPGGSVPARGIQEKSKCKKAGWWRFRSLKRSYARDGVYCWTHLVVQGIYGDEAERTRTDRWLEKNGWLDEDGVVRPWPVSPEPAT